MTPTIEIERARDHAEHLVPRQEWVVSLNIDLVGVIGDEFQTCTIGVENLAAARHEARSIRYDWTNGV